MVAGMLTRDAVSDSGSNKGGSSTQRLDQRQRQVLQARQQMMQMTNLRLPLSILTLMVKTATGITR